MRRSKTDIFADWNEEQIGIAANIFKILISGHSQFAERVRSRNVSPQSQRFKSLIDDFTAATTRIDQRDLENIAEDHENLKNLLKDFMIARERDRGQQEEFASDFNILGVLGLIGKEIRHSMVLAWLLDHRIEKYGTHAQGKLGFQLFLRALGLPLEYADSSYWVRREEHCQESIIDLEIGSRNRFLIHVENKIWSSEGSDQTHREWADIQRRARAIGIDPTSPGAPVHALYLTPTGASPMNPQFRPISWLKIVGVLDSFARLAKPQDVKLFASHYARGIRRFVLAQKDKEEQDAEDIIE